MPAAHSVQAVPASNTVETRLPRNPFDSPSPSGSSLHGTDEGSTSEQDECPPYRSSNTDGGNHLRQISRSSNNDNPERKLNLNIITNLSDPKMPMETQTVVVDEIAAKQIRTERKRNAFSIVSHRAVPATASPSEQPLPQLSTPTPMSSKALPFEILKTWASHQRPKDISGQRQKPSFTQRIPIGITIPQQDAAKIDQAITDSALHTVTPMTPAIVVTPADAQKPWTFQKWLTNAAQRSPSSIHPAVPNDKPDGEASVAPPLPRSNLTHDEDLHHREGRASYDSRDAIIPDSAESARPKSQGWWNLMLSPLLRAGSVASRKGKQNTDTPPVPPLPFAYEKSDSPALSARTDPSFLVSSNESSPDTPRRQGLASARASIWSRWTEWEQEREATEAKDLSAEKDIPPDVDHIQNGAPTQNRTGTGLAAEYFHACAVEQMTGQPYFECINHSCAERLPKLHTEKDTQTSGAASLAAPFESPVAQARGDLEARGTQEVNSPSDIDGNGELSPHELSPNVRNANLAPVVKAKVLQPVSDKGSETMSVEGSVAEQTQDNAKAPPPTTMSPAQAATTHLAPQDNGDKPNVASVAPPVSVLEIKVTREDQAPAPAHSEKPEKASDAAHTDIVSPGSMSPEGEKSLAPQGAVPLSEFDRQPQYPPPVVYNNYVHHGHLPERLAFVNAETEYPPLPDRQPTAPVTAADIQAPNRDLNIEQRRRRHEAEDAIAKKAGGLWRGRGCLPKNGCMGRGGPEHRIKRRWAFGVGLLLLAIIITCIVLAVTLTRRGDGTPVDSLWLNLTGFPPMPTGILTIAAPNLVASQKQCVSPTTMWTCSVPKEDRDEIGANDPDQPNFRFEIKFRNGTVPSNMTIVLDGSHSGSSKPANDPFTNDLFVADPSPPNQPDQIFMGQTTDNVTAPFDGEQTPFYITFMSVFPIVPAAFNNTGASSSKRLLQRDSNSSLTNNLPAPALAGDGSAAPASLLPTTPYPISQPVRLYNRGLPDEHYGFYIYYDKSIFLSGLHINGSEQASFDILEADQDGGSTKSQATARCTFAQTRFLVKFFTQPSFASLLPSPLNANLTHPDDQKKNNATSSAIDFDRPGSFPYPTTVIIDRHGGDIDSKIAFCYGMSNGQITKADKTLVGEIRSFGGTLVNPAPNILEDPSDFNQTAGGIDGGTGGCGCTWQNWQ